MDLIYVKTILRTLKNLERIIAQLDELIFDKAICTNMRLSDCAYNSAQSQVEKVLALMNKKNNLINMKLAADESLEKMNGESALLLKMRFIERRNPDEIAEFLKISPRTYFRYLEKAYVSFGKQLVLGGFTEDWFKKNFFDQRWIRELYERVELGARSQTDES